MKVIMADEPGFQKMLAEFKNRISFDDDILEAQVKGIIHKVRQEGDHALMEYTALFDNVTLEKSELVVTPQEIEEAYTSIPPEKIDVLRLAIERISAFHSRQRRNSWIQPEPDGTVLGQMITPLDKVGIYVPGGKAPYPSTVIMCAIPARIAGVRKVYCVTPPQTDHKINPYILIAADMSGVDTIFKAGGVQAIAAFAYGTETMPGVDKIVGPGNIYVTIAKRLVFGQVDIDMLAGPSEILIVADEQAPPAFIAADLLSQAEHDERASCILITSSQSLIAAVSKEITARIEKLKRRDICCKSLEHYGLIIQVKDIDQAMEIVNYLSPEHLELAVNDPFPLVSKVKNAGSLFLGYYTPEPVGDYIAGPNHVLPTGGTARFFSALGVDDFIKRSGISYYTKEGLKTFGEKAAIMAGIEGLDAHSQSIKLRIT